MAVLSEGEERLLAFIREGRVDAEIAVRLGLSTGEVRERTRALAAKVGVPGKAELAAFRGQHGSETPALDPGRNGLLARPAVAAGIVAGVVLFALGAWLGRSTAEDSTRGATAATTPSPASVVTQPPATVPPPLVLTLDGAAAMDLGQLVTVPAPALNPVLDVDRRETLAVVTLAGAGVVHMQGPYLRLVRNGGAYSETTLGTQLVAVFVFPADRNTEFIPIDGGFAVYAKGDALPRLLVWATETRGVAQDTRWARSFHVSVTTSGELLVSVDPVSPALAINNRTGESLDLSHARKVGVLPPLLGNTFCDAEEGCVVAWRGAGLPAPFDGIARCGDTSAFEYGDPSTGVRLVFDTFAGSPSPACPPSPQSLRAGDLLGSGSFVLRGMDPSGRPVALAVAGDGSLYAGDIVPKIDCPCLHFN